MDSPDPRVLGHSRVRESPDCPAEGEAFRTFQRGWLRAHDAVLVLAAPWEVALGVFGNIAKANRKVVS
jgi:hypothetical protein